MSNGIFLNTKNIIKESYNKVKNWVVDKAKRAWDWTKKNVKKVLVTAGIIGVATAATLPTAIQNEVSLEKIQQKYNQSQEMKAKYSIDGASLKRVNIFNAELTNKGEAKDKVVVEIGDSKSAEFSPQIKLSRWDEVDFKIIPNLEGVATRDKTLEFVGDKILFGTPKMDYEFYGYEEGEGGYKFIWYLNEKPDSNKIEFQIESEGLDFFYQPELTQEEIDEGHIRPENVIGSYAVYHQTKGRMNDIDGKEYKVGKAFHIYRPHLYDSNGLEAWGNLHIENGIYSVEIPQEFLDKAVYPIRSNDNFGYTAEGATAGIASANYIEGSGNSYAGVAGTGLSMSIYGNDSGTDIKLGLYKESDSSLVGYTNPVALPATKDWVSNDFVASTTTENINYYLFFRVESADATVYYDANEDAYYRYLSLAYSSEWPNPVSMNLFTPADRDWSIYVTYELAGGAAAPELLPRTHIID